MLGRDPRTDIAVLKISADHKLPYVAFGDCSAAQVGDWVIAVGNPFGLGGSVTTGIISARGRDIHSASSMTTCRSTRRSIAAIPAARPLTATAR